MSRKLKVATSVFVLISLLLLALRYSYYGSLFRSCIYTEKELTLSKKIRESKILFIKSAVIVSDVTKNDYSCLPNMGSIVNSIVEQRYAYIYKNRNQFSVGPSDNIELEAIKLIAVTKHGITTIDSGSGPVVHLLLRDAKGIVYEVPTVGLGINEKDEFLKAVLGSEEFILNPNTSFTE